MELNKRPNIVLIMNDDMGYSDLQCYGGEIETPNLNRLVNQGIQFTQFYNTARCSPSRASLMTGLHPHQTGIGILTDDHSPDGYPGNLNTQCATLAEILKPQGYSTYMSGKWHMAHDFQHEKHTWPLQRGFEKFYGTIAGAGSFHEPNTLTRGNDNIDHEANEENFYYTDAISDQAVRFIEEHAEEKRGVDQPFFQYVAYTAPHWPLHAKDEDIAKYKGRFDEGWDQLRQERLKRMISLGIIDCSWELTERDPSQPDWEKVEHREWLLRCMEVYAAQIDCMDQGIGRIVNALERTGQLDNTILLFLADNGGCAELLDPAAHDLFVDHLLIARSESLDGEPILFGNRPELMPGPKNTYQSYGVAWANLSNTPFRLYKHWVHEGGISTPLIVHWPEGLRASGELRHTPAQLVDIVPTLLELANASYPEQLNGHKLLPLEGRSLKNIFEQDEDTEVPLFWEHEGNSAIRIGKWKLVKKYPGDWELYNMIENRTETVDLATQYPDKVKDMSGMYNEWAARCSVVARDTVEKIIEERKRT